MSKLRGLILSGCVLAMAACSNFDAHSEIDALNEAKAVGSPFTQHLAAEYRSFANSEMHDMLDYPDGIHFARKGLAAAAGETVMPEPISDWNLNPRHMEELSTARGRLVVAFDMGARQIAPQQSAIAQARFDCWIEQQEEKWQEEDIAGCKNQFMQAMNALDGMMKPPPAPEPMPPVEATAPPPAEPMKPEDAMYLVFFDFDKSTIGAGGENVLDAVAQEVKSRSLNAINIVGHADSSGSKILYTLSKKSRNPLRIRLFCCNNWAWTQYKTQCITRKQLTRLPCAWSRSIWKTSQSQRTTVLSGLTVF